MKPRFDFAAVAWFLIVFLLLNVMPGVAEGQDVGLEPLGILTAQPTEAQDLIISDFRPISLRVHYAPALQTAAPVLQEPEEAPVEEPEEEGAVTVLFGLTGAVWTLMEVLKRSVIRPFFVATGLHRATNGGVYVEMKPWGDEAYSVINIIVAVLLGSFLLYGAGPGLDIFTVAGYGQPQDPTYAHWVTAFIMGFGSGGLHVAIDFIRYGRRQRQVAVIRTNSGISGAEIAAAISRSP